MLPAVDAMMVPFQNKIHFFIRYNKIFSIIKSNIINQYIIKYYSKIIKLFHFTHVMVSKLPASFLLKCSLFPTLIAFFVQNPKIIILSVFFFFLFFTYIQIESGTFFASKPFLPTKYINTSNAFMNGYSQIQYYTKSLQHSGEQSKNSNTK